MNVNELIAKLQQYDGEAEIKVAGQPSYPMEVELIGVAMATGRAKDDDDECQRPRCYDARSNHPNGGACIARDLDDDTPCDCKGWQYDDDETSGAVWVVVGDNVGYGVPREVYDDARYGW